jgi:hypothetical protein
MMDRFVTVDIISINTSEELLLKGNSLQFKYNEYNKNGIPRRDYVI